MNQQRNHLEEIRQAIDGVRVLAEHDMSDETLEKAAWLYLRKALPSGTVPDGMRIHDAVSMVRQQMHRREQALRKLEQTAAARAADTSPPVPKKSRRK